MIDDKMKKNSLLYKFLNLYYDGFRNMTVDKTLWTVILVKLFIIFIILKLLFFPDFLKNKAGSGNEADYVSKELTSRGVK